MNDTIRIRPEVEAFVAAVRARFGDLDPDEREDLLEGLEADISDLVAERGPEALGDPDAYAAELRAAAGVAPRTRRGFGRKVPAKSPTMAIDDARTWFDAEVAERPWAGCAMEFLTAVRPAWWVLRAWLLVQALDALLGPWEELTLVPSLMIPGAGLVLFLLAVVASVQVGRGQWPTERFVPAARRRAVVFAGNVALLAIALPLTVSQAENELWWNDYSYAMASARTTGVTNDGQQVCNLQAYDAAGQPLVGVQLFDNRGRAFDVRCPDRWGKAAYPWYLGDVARWNVFPMAERKQRSDDRMVERAYESPRPPAFPVTDRATVPAVTHPLVPAQVEESMEESVDDVTGAPGDPTGTKPDGTKPRDRRPDDAKPRPRAERPR